jgi:hypothetical protein
MPRGLRFWGVLASICVVVKILLANEFPLSWIAVCREIELRGQEYHGPITAAFSARIGRKYFVA